MLAPPRRKYRIIHEPYLVSWLQREFPPGTWRTNVRLGAVRPEILAEELTPGELRALRLWLPRADAVVLLPEKVIIVEALVRPEFWKLYMLKTYGELCGVTEEFRMHWEKPRELVVLTTIINRYWQAQAEVLGIRWVIWRPPAAEEYLGTLRLRQRRPTRGG